MRTKPITYNDSRLAEPTGISDGIARRIGAQLMPTYSGEHEVADGDEILGDKQICSQYDKIEADKEEDRRRQRFPHLVQGPQP